MKTIATAAALMMLAVPTWADEQTKSEANDPATTNDPIVLSEAEMDGVTAGGVSVEGFRFDLMGHHTWSSTSSSSSSYYEIMDLNGDMLPDK